MKKLFLSLTCMVVSVAAMAQMQVKVSAQFAKGDYAIYTNTNESTVSSPMGGEPMKILKTSEVKYMVTAVRNDGYTIEVTATHMSDNEAIADSPAAKLMTDWNKKLEGKTLVLETDKDGKILKLSNLDALKAEMGKVRDELIATLPAEEIKGQEEVLRTALNSMMTEEKIIPMIAEGNFFEFYGKTINTGMMEDNTIDGVKAKTTYIVSAPKNSDTYTIKSTMSVNMSKEDMKEMLVKQLGESMPDQIETLMPQIEQMIESGMMKVEGTGHATHIFTKKGWPQSVESVTNIGVMGANTESVFKSILKESK